MNTARTAEKIVSEMKAANVKMLERKIHPATKSRHYLITKNGVVVHTWCFAEYGWHLGDIQPSIVGVSEKEARQQGFKTVTNASTKKYYSGRIVPIILEEA